VFRKLFEAADLICTRHLFHQVTVFGSRWRSLTKLCLTPRDKIEGGFPLCTVHQKIGLRRFETTAIKELVRLAKDLISARRWSALQQRTALASNGVKYPLPPGDKLFRWEICPALRLDLTLICGQRIHLVFL
jgi:hypothetical protein